MLRDQHIGWPDSACGTLVQLSRLSSQPSVEQAARKRLAPLRAGRLQVPSACTQAQGMRTWPRLCARGRGSEHLVRIILYLPGWLIGARALAWKRDAAIRPREVSRGKSAGVWHTIRTWGPHSPVTSAEGCSPCSVGLEGGRRLGHKFKPRRAASLCNLS